MKSVKKTPGIRRLGLLAFFAGAMIVLPVSQGRAAGALAVGVPSDVARLGFAYGISYDQPDEATASAQALEYCRTASAGSQEAHAVCTVVTSYRHQCGAVTMDPAAGTPGVGWAVAPQLEDAKEQALNNCRATAGEARKAYCEVAGYSCDSR